MRPTADWPGTFGGSTLEFPDQLSADLGSGFSSASSTENPDDASERWLPAEQCAARYARLTRIVTEPPRKDDLRR